MRDAGRLAVRAGSIESANITRAGIEVVWRPRGTQQRERVIVGRIINCTGPDHRPARSDSKLVQSLLTSGLITPDPLELGIRVTDACEVIAADGHIAKGLYYVGPWLRARHWEATAVPELREHARRLAERLAGPAVKEQWRRGSAAGAWQLAEGTVSH